MWVCICLYPDRCDLSDPLGIGMILAVFHSEGTVQLEMDMLKEVVSEGVMLTCWQECIVTCCSLSSAAGGLIYSLIYRCGPNYYARIR